MVTVPQENIQTMELILAILLVNVAQAGIKGQKMSAVVVTLESMQVAQVVQYVQRARRATIRRALRLRRSLLAQCVLQATSETRAE